MLFKPTFRTKVALSWAFYSATWLYLIKSDTRLHVKSGFDRPGYFKQRTYGTADDKWTISVCLQLYNHRLRWAKSQHGGVTIRLPVIWVCTLCYCLSQALRHLWQSMGVPAISDFPTFFVRACSAGMCTDTFHWHGHVSAEFTTKALDMCISQYHTDQNMVLQTASEELGKTAHPVCHVRSHAAAKGLI